MLAEIFKKIGSKENTREVTLNCKNIMTIPHEWRMKSVISPRESKNIVSRERSSSETMFLVSRGEMTDLTCHEL